MEIIKIENYGIISTHTLTWSVTNVALKNSATQAISTHTLTWSVTALKFYNDKTTLNFNSHAHVERDT